MGEKISNQIAVYKTNKVLLEMQNCLKPAPKEFPWHIHAAGKKEGYSLIRLVAMDYSDKNETISVYANLRPDTILYLYAQLCSGYEYVHWNEQKIFKDEESAPIHGLSISAMEKERWPITAMAANTVRQEPMRKKKVSALI